MRWLPSTAGCVILLVALASKAAAGETANHDPVRLIPAQAEIVVKIQQPRALVDAIYKHEALQALSKLDFVKPYFENTNFRRLLQFLTYLEKQLDGERFDLLDRLAGRGIAFGLELNQGNKPSYILAIGAKDEKLLEQFFDMA